DHGIGDRGEQGEWRGPGAGPGYREARDPRRVRGFSSGASAGGQVPGEIREWGRRGDRGERRIHGEGTPGDRERRADERVRESGELLGEVRDIEETIDESYPPSASERMASERVAAEARDEEDSGDSWTQFFQEPIREPYGGASGSGEWRPYGDRRHS